MKIALINNLYKPFNRGGAETVVELMAEGLNQAGHQVFIITTKPYFKKFSIFNFQFSIYHINSLYYYLHKTPKFLRIFWHVIDMLDLGSYWQVKSILKKEKPDMVITHNLKGVGYLIPLAVKQLKIKHCHYLHDIQLIHPSGLMICGQEEKINTWWAKMYQAICRRLFDSPEVVLSPSRWLLNFHEQKKFFPLSKKVVLANPTSPQTLSLLRRGQPARFALRSKAGGGEVKREKPFCFLFVGQIEYHKGILLLLDAFKNLEEKNCELLIVGTGSLLDEAQKLARENNKIKFLGWKNIDEMWQSAHCLIVPSLCYENSPTVIIKALVAGLPIIASDLGGVQELLVDGGGILFKPGDMVELKNKMTWVLNNRSGLQKISLTGKEKAKQFNTGMFIKKLVELIE